MEMLNFIYPFQTFNRVLSVYLNNQIELELIMSELWMPIVGYWNCQQRLFNVIGVSSYFSWLNVI